MANLDAPAGLRPVRHRNGAPYSGSGNPYFINSSYGTALFVGDPVVKVTGGSNTAEVTVPGMGRFPIGTIPEINKSKAGDDTDGTFVITGVIQGFSADATALENKHNPASTERVALVCDDPDVIFEVQADGAVSADTMGLNANLIFTNAGVTATGLSGVELDTSSMTANASNQLLILRAVNREDNDTTITNPKVLVLINQHTENQGTVGALGI